jgi:pilus assembly protein Flp/PilA
MKIPMRKLISRFLQNQSGTTAIEYGLIASLIAITVIGGMSRIGQTELTSTFAKVNAAFTG